MPFRFSHNKTSESSIAPDFGSLIIRVIFMIALGYYQISGQLASLWGFLWEQKDWGLVSQVESIGLPVPSTIAVTLIFLILLSMISIFIGIFTRINSVILLLLLGFVLIAPLKLSAGLNPQTLALYIGALFSLIFSGGGKASLDFFLARRKANAINRR